jgi:NADH-quinone oxidoreductase subunit L
MWFIAGIGCFTAIFAALIAVQQNDIKRILAYSTLSQLGYMVMAVGCYGPDAAMFHLSTHAFVKALLFLAAGSVIHALHDEQDIWKMGGLFWKIPITSWTFLIGMLALSGVFPFAGFWSKDYLLSIAYARSPFFYAIGVITAFLTAFYMTRLVVIAFFGRARTKEAEHPHESPWHMTTPLIVLAVLSVCGGFIGLKDYYHGWSLSVIEGLGFPSNAVLPEANAFMESILPGAIVLLGIVCAGALYWNVTTDPLEGGFFRILANKFYFDDIYDTYVVGTQQLFARSFAWIDSWIIDGLIIRGAAYVCVGFGELLRLFQTGNLQAYAYFFTLGGIILIYFTLFR